MVLAGSAAVAAIFPFLLFCSAANAAVSDAEHLRHIITVDGISSLRPALVSVDLSNDFPRRHLAVTAVTAPSASPLRRQKHRIRKWFIGFLIGSVSGIVTGLVLSVLFRLLLNCLRRRYRSRSGAEIFSPAIKSKKDLAFLSEDLDLSSLPLIGRGGSGDVYLKELPTTSGVKQFAIKQIRSRAGDPSLSGEQSRDLDKWTRQILSEIKTVGRIRHRNLLPLIAHVSFPHRHFLFYEFMKNGSLHAALAASSSGQLDLTWPARHRIAIGIAAGLEHLHLHHKPHIVHRDLKPGNVLLDEKMEARIADFGFAKEVPEEATHLTMSNVAGTVGYIAPEYYQTMKYTAKCDVYSLGVILAVVVMGRFPSDEFFEDMGLVKRMRNELSAGNEAACFDGKIAGKGFNEKMALALKLACFCTADAPDDRPSSKEVRLMLEQIAGAAVDSPATLGGD